MCKLCPQARRKVANQDYGVEGDRGQQFFQSTTVAEQNATKPERLVPLPLLVIKENRYFEHGKIGEIHSFSHLFTASM